MEFTRSVYTMGAHFHKPRLSSVSKNSKSTKDERLRHVLIFGMLDISHLGTPFNELWSHTAVHKLSPCYL